MLTEENRVRELEEDVRAIRASIGEISAQVKELNWANVFHDTIKKSTWLKNKSFSPGRWAVGYGFLYVMYRVLNEIKPKCILDLGLGETSRMISQYAVHYKGVRHLVLESDEEWVEFFKKRHHLPPTTEIRLCPYEMKAYNKVSVRSFSGFMEAIGENIFDFVVIDAPLTRAMTTYARVDFLEALSTNFSQEKGILMLDDTQFGVIQNTRNLFLERLTEFEHAEYVGEKRFSILCPQSMKWLTTL